MTAAFLLFRIFSRCLALLGLSGLLLFAGAVAAEELRPNAHLAVMEQAPYGFYDAQGQAKGYLHDIGQAILQRAGLTDVVPMHPMRRLFKYVEGGAIDCTLLAASPFTRSHFRLVESTGLMLAPGIVPRAGIDLNSYADLQGLTIGVPRGVSFDDHFDQDETLIKVSTKDYPGSVIMLQNGRVDAIVGVWGSYLFNALELGHQPETLFGKPLIFQNLPIWLVCQKEGGSEELEANLKAATLALRQEGVMQKIAERYLGKTQ